MTLEPELRKRAQHALAAAIRGYLLRHNVVYREFGRELGISEQYVYKLLGGRGWPSVPVLVRLRQLRVVDFNALLDDVAT